MSYYIYQTTNLINGHYYIGMHVGELNDSYIGSGKILKQAINKYGKSNFKKEVLVICESEKELRIWEEKIVKLKIKDPKCYNLAPGGQGGSLIKYFSIQEQEEIRKKASKAIREWNKQNPNKVKERQERQKITLINNFELLSANIKESLAKKTKEEKEKQHRKVTDAKLKAGFYSIFQLIDREGVVVMESIGAENIAKKYSVSSNGVRLAAKHKKPIKRGNLTGYKVVKKKINSLI
jgi:hypothetical protein